MNNFIEKIKSYLTKICSNPLRLIFLLICCLSIVWIIKAGCDPDPYLQSRSIPPPHPYPTKFVRFLIIVTVIQAVLTLLVDYFIHSIWKLLPLLLIAIGSLFVVGIFAMHGPPPIGAFLLCQSLWIIILLITAISILLYELLSFVYHHLP